MVGQSGAFPNREWQQRQPEDSSAVIIQLDIFFPLKDIASPVESALGLDAIIGNFKVGKEFDALLINTKASDSPFDLFASDTFEDIIQKFLYLGDDRNIEEVYVAGKLVVPFSSSV
ncbi:UNVERIFIED_CONTAM: hypothetical protein K2H54_046310 [Gekko kuhli]